MFPILFSPVSNISSAFGFCMDEHFWLTVSHCLCRDENLLVSLCAPVHMDHVHAQFMNTLTPQTCPSILLIRPHLIGSLVMSLVASPPTPSLVSFSIWLSSVCLDQVIQLQDTESWTQSCHAIRFFVFMNTCTKPKTCGDQYCLVWLWLTFSYTGHR